MSRGRASFPFSPGETETHRSSAYSSYPHRKLIGHSIRRGPFRYTEWYDKKSDELSTAVLTNLAEYPGEQTNVIDEPGWAADLAELQKELRSRILSAVE